MKMKKKHTGISKNGAFKEKQLLSTYSNVDRSNMKTPKGNLK